MTTIPRSHLPSDDAVTFLRELIAKARAGRLPSIRRLAQAAGVAPNTLRRALDLLAAEGVVSVRSRSGVRIVDKQGAEPAPDPTEAVRRRLTRDVIDGRYSAGASLPPLTKLAKTFGTGFRTLRRVVREMENGGLLQRAGQRYRVAPRATANRPTSLAVFVEADSSGAIRVFHDWHKIFTHALEREAEASGLALHTFGTGSERHVRAALREIRPRNVIGAVTLGSVYRYVEPLSGDFGKLNLPVAVFDEDNLVQVAAGPTSRRVGVFPLPWAAAARSVAHYLLARGHRVGAYLSPFHATDWSKARCDLLRDMFRRSGTGAVLKEYVLDRDGSAETWRGQGDGGGRAPTAQRAPGKQSRQDSLPSSVRLSRDLATYWARVPDALGPLLRAALADRTCSCWITANDFVAEVALEFLGTTKARVPRDISLISFDNSMSALEGRVTSYDFDIPTLARHVVHWILRPRPERCGVSPAQLPQGRIIERGSVGTVSRDAIAR